MATTWFLSKIRAASILMVAVLLAAPLWSIQSRVAAASWLTGWSTRYAITVRNQNATALTNYQVKAVLPATFNYSSAQASGADIRITSSDGVSPLNFWIESFDPAAKSGVVWAAVPQLKVDEAATIYLYVGNPTALSQSNGKATFALFSDFNNPSWRNISDLPIQIADETAAQAYGYIYIFGGYRNSAQDPLNTVYAYKPETNTYVQVASMPTLRWGAIAATVDNKIYVFGGRNTSGGSNANEMLDPMLNTWTKKAPLPAAMADQGISGCTDGSMIYLTYNSRFYAYDPRTDRYTQKASLPKSVLSWATCAYAKGKIYIINGYSGGAKNYTQIYDIATNRWSQGAPSPFAMYGSVRENPIIGDNIYLVQGQRADYEFSSVAYKYNISSNTWTQKSFGPHAADGVAGGVYNGAIYTFGGRQDGSGPYGFKAASVYQPSLDVEDSWSQVYGNYEAGPNGLRRMVPTQGDIDDGPVVSHIRSNFPLYGAFVLEVKMNQTVSSYWNTIAIQANTGNYNNNLNAYHPIYNDDGVIPRSTSFYKEAGTVFTKLQSAASTTGSQRYSVATSAGATSVYRNGQLLYTVKDSSYVAGYVHVISSNGNTTAFNFIFARNYAAVEPAVTVSTVASAL